MLRVLVVDDSVVYRKIITKAVESTGLARVQASAATGTDGVKLIKEQRLDVVLLDIQLPDIHGIEVLMQMVNINPNLKVVMITSSPTEMIAKLTIEALEKGAVDFISKPLGESFDKNMKFVADYLLQLFSQWSKPTPRSVAKTTPASVSEATTEKKPSRRRFDMCVIASSTGGPAALEFIAKQLPANLRVPLIIIQHMPRDFTRVLAESLNNHSPLAITEANHQEPIEARRGFVAPGGLHLTIKKVSNQYMFQLDESEYVNGVRPAADKLLSSIAKSAPGMRVLVVVLTGMGVDATAGIRDLKKFADCYTLAQDEATSVVFGMPRSVIVHGLADEVLPLSEIASRLTELVQIGVETRANESL